MDEADRRRSRDLVIDLDDPEIETRRKAIEAREDELRLERLRRKQVEQEKRPPLAIKEKFKMFCDAAGSVVMLGFLLWFFGMALKGCGSAEPGALGVPSRYQD